MKAKLLLPLLLFAAYPLHAGIFTGPTTTTNRLVLAAGQAAVINGIYPEKQYDSNLNVTYTAPISASIISGEQTTPIYIGECKQGTTALVGPVELVVSTPAIISYQTLSNTPLQSLLVLPGSTNSINVPAGKSIKFLSFDLSGFDVLIADAQITVNGGTFQGFDIFGGAEFDGPLAISFSYPPSFDGTPALGYILPFYLTDSSLVLPSQMALQSATGNVEVQIQKSSDLTNWYSSVAIPATNNTQTFYRLRIQQ
jgi:hypothetical protein